MDRRRFLGVTTIAGAASLVLPSWLSRAFAQDHHSQDFGAPEPPPPPQATTSVAILSAAYRDAQRLGKPLLVLVVPDDRDTPDSWNRAMAFGELLNHGGDDVLADLALTHVVCAKMSELHQLVPQSPPGSPLMVLVEPDRVPATAHAVDVALRFDPPESGFDGRHSWEQRQHLADVAIDARLRALSAALHQALAPDGATLAARAQVARAHVDAPTLALVDNAARGGAPLDAATADRAAAVVALAAASAPATAQRALRASLVAATTARLKTSRVPGSVWADGGGCGTTIEGVEDNVMMGCGMGFMPERSSRFLYFYSRMNW